MASVMPFRFDWGDHPARRLHPLAKLGTLLVLSISASMAGSLGLTVLAAVAVAMLALAGAFRPHLLEGMLMLLRQARFLLPLGLLVAVFRVVDPGGQPLFRLQELPPTALYLTRLAVVFAFAEAFFRSTSAAELASATSCAVRSVARRRDIDPGLYLSLVVSFIPRCLEAWERSREAAVVRGYGGWRTPFRSTLLLLESFIANSIRGALTTADALQTRGYTPSRSFAPMVFRMADGVVLVTALAVAWATSLR